MIIRIIPGNIWADNNDVEDVKIRWHEGVDRCCNWFISSFVKALAPFKGEASSNHPSKYLAIFAFVYSNSITAYGSPMQTSKGVLENGKLHQSFRRDRSNEIRVLAVIPISLSVVMILLMILGCVKGNIITRRRNPEANSMPQELTAGQLAESVDNQSTDNQDQNPDAPERTRRPRPRPLTSSTHSLPAYAKEPGESEQVILNEIRGPLTNRPLQDVVEEVGTSAENSQESQRPSYSVPANPPCFENHAADESSSSNPLHRPSGNGIGVRVRTVNSHDSTGSNIRGEAPPPYVEVVDQRDVDHR